MIVFAAMHGAILRRLQQDFHVDVAAITVIGEDRNRFHHLLLTPYSEEMEQMSSPRGPMTCCERVLHTAAPLRVARTSDLPEGTACPMMQAEGLEAYLGLPLLTDGVPSGAIEVMSRAPRVWTDAEFDRLSAFASVIQEMIDDGVAAPKSNANVVRFR